LWSGAGSNCRPSAFQPVFPLPKPFPRCRVKAQLTSVTAGQWTNAAMLPLFRPGPPTSVLSVGFLCQHAHSQPLCGHSVGPEQSRLASALQLTALDRSRGCLPADPRDLLPGLIITLGSPCRLVTVRLCRIKDDRPRPAMQVVLLHSARKYSAMDSRVLRWMRPKLRPRPAGAQSPRVRAVNDSFSARAPRGTCRPRS
jgi:hypothetical protein